MKVGLVVNPVAGLGGAVGLKGTDGAETVAEALKRGAVPQAGARARRAMALLAQRVPGAAVTVAPGALGADWVEGLDLAVEVLRLGPPSGSAQRHAGGGGGAAGARPDRLRGRRRDGAGCGGAAAAGRRGVWGYPAG